MQNNMRLKPVVLLQPYNTCRNYTRSGSVYPPLGLCQLAAVDKFNIMQVVDAEALSISDADMERLLIESSVSICGITATSYNLDVINKWANFCAKNNIALVVGGPHPTLSPKSTFEKCPNLKYIIRGEGELVVNEMFQLDNKSVEVLPGVCINDNGRTVISDIILRVTDFSNHPFPEVASLPIDKYYCPDAIESPMITFSIQRGCPNGCKFCSTSQMSGKKVRGWSAEQIIKELEFLYFDLGVKELSFVDDVFTLYKKKIGYICNNMIAKGMKFSWFCNIRANQIDYELATIMKKAGCHQTYIGVESGSQKILDSVNKRETIEQMYSCTRLLKEVGIDRSVGFIIGLPGETEETVQQTIEFAQKIKPERLQFTRFTPLVGSEYENLIPTSNRGFHDNTMYDNVTEWINKAYSLCNGTNGGKQSL